MNIRVKGRISEIEVYDIETIINLFVFVGINARTLDKKIFVIHDTQNDIYDLIDHLKSGISQVGYNNLNFDSQVLREILSKEKYLKSLDGDKCAREIYQIAQECIERTNGGGWPKYPEWVLKNKQLDLYRIHHYDNRNRSTRLKDLQVCLKWHNVLDMPINHDEFVYTQDQINTVIEYCINDVESTHEFYKYSFEQIKMRQQLSQDFNIDVRNSSDPGIGSKIFLKLLSEELNIPDYELKKMRTFRSKIDLNDCILPIINFKTKKFNKLLDNFRKTIIKNTKGEFKKSIITDNGLEITYGLGGIHACAKPGIYKSDKNKIIKSCDVSSMYPNISINNDFYPEHLGIGYCKVYKMIYNLRKSYPKEDARNKGLKLSLNGSYGNSNQPHSFLYDPKMTMQITVNGQLMLTMLTERLEEAGFQVIMINTDGLECIIDRNKEQLYNDICTQWEKDVNLKLEFVDYEKMVIRDVNNYLSQDIKGKTKYKGALEIDKEYHKDPSFRIVSLAISDYYLKDISVEDTIKNHKDIFDFYGRAKFKSDSYGEIRYISGNNIKKEKQQKTTRYFVSNSQSTFYKIYNKGSEEVINKGYNITIANKHNSLYINDIDHQFYINECYKIMDIITPRVKQLDLF